MASRQDVFAVIVPFYVVLKLFGMFPTSFDAKRRFGALSVKWHDKISSLAAALVMVCMGLSHHFSSDEKFTKSLLVVNGWRMSLSCSLVLLMITFIYQNLKNQAAVNFLNILDDFNVRAKVLEVKLSMENERAVVVKTMTALACGILGVSCGSAVMFKSNDPYGTRYTMPLYFGYVLLYLSLLILQFSFATMAIKSRFSVLNENLRLTFLNISAQHSSLNNAPSIAYTEHLSSVITDLYSNLCDAIDSVNASFTFQLIPFAIYYLTANMFAIYSIVREIFHRSQLMYVVVFTSFCWIVLHTVIISIAVHSGYQATKCALQAPIIVSSIVKNCKWREQKCVVRVLKTFLLEFQHRNVYFENEFFRIDWKLLLSMISTITTFLVITCQFDAAFDEAAAKAVNSTF